MKYKVRDPSITSVSDLVRRNTGMDERSLLCDSHEYDFPALYGAVELIRKWVKEGRKFFVFADYDVDGITSGLSTYMLLRSLGVPTENITVRYPKRFTEGYGMSVKAVQEFDDGGVVITVDNGITAFDAIKEAKRKGMEVLVTDHHLAAVDGSGHKVYPDADYIVDPNAIDGQAEFKEYCGCGLVLKLAEIALADQPEHEKTLCRIRAMAAVATIADSVPLVGENRQIVKDGLRLLTRRDLMTTGLSALLHKAFIWARASLQRIAFGLAPMLNAFGRLNDDGASKVAEILGFDGNESEAEANAEMLAQANADRKALQAQWFEIALPKAQALVESGKNHVILYLPGCPEGIIGILAGILAERCSVPTIVLTDSHVPGMLKGSGRSAGHTHLRERLDQCCDSLAGYGGHAAAAGVRVKFDKLSDFEADFAKAMGDWKPEEQEVYYDLEIDAADVESVANEVEMYGPYGEGNPAPVFLIKNVCLTPKGGSYYSELKSNGVKVFAPAFTATSFGDCAKEYLTDKPRHINLLGTIDLNYFGSKRSPEVNFTSYEAVEKATNKITPLQLMLQRKAAGE